ncbi:hypothetical protein CVT24_004359 [Panaeolus cyanescens]|uniref:Tc1-like transposase DDE domain-containing protein n=1 Tax=Panaeolus cyanescens TaxID=181874 RepID=A0A409YBF4_9AGAR|nr:hypothetical protein CVT24_004359 [Panaeolus cyanescens]
MILKLSLIHGYKQKKIRTITGVSIRSIKRIRTNWRRTGAVIQIPAVKGRCRILNAFEVSFLEGCIEQKPDLLLSELQDRLKGSCGVDVSPVTIWRSLKRRGFSRKRATKPAIERDEDDRANYHLIIGSFYEPEQLVFVDESAFDRRVAGRRYVWAPTGNRGRRRDFFIRGIRYSILPALSLDGIIALEVLDEPFTSESFRDFIALLLERMNPWPERNSVIIMDNAKIHKSVEIEEMVRNRGMRIVFLPAYSPDLNPIEEAFSSIKNWLRTNRDYVLLELTGQGGDPYRVIWDAVYSVTPQKAAGWFAHSGYII